MTRPTHIDEGLARINQLRSRLRPVEGEEPPPVPAEDDLDDEDIAATLAAEAHARREYVWRRICPQKFHDVSLDWVRREHGDAVVDTLAEWSALAPRPNLIVSGPIGSGKTGTVLAAVRDDFLERALTVAFWPVVDLLDDLRPGGRPGVKDELVDAPRLILDDLGAEKPTDWTWERLYSIVNRRWLDERPTVVTTNLALSGNGDDLPLLRDVIGERVYSRLVGENAYVIELQGKDRRRG